MRDCIRLFTRSSCRSLSVTDEATGIMSHCPSSARARMSQRLPFVFVAARWAAAKTADAPEAKPHPRQHVGDTLSSSARRENYEPRDVVGPIALATNGARATAARAKNSCPEPTGPSLLLY